MVLPDARILLGFPGACSLDVGLALGLELRDDTDLQEEEGGGRLEECVLSLGGWRASILAPFLRAV